MTRPLDFESRFYAPAGALLYSGVPESGGQRGDCLSCPSVRSEEGKNAIFVQDEGIFQSTLLPSKYKDAFQFYEVYLTVLISTMATLFRGQMLLPLKDVVAKRVWQSTLH